MPVDLVVDHSVQVDNYGAADSLRRNNATEFARNGERYRSKREADRHQELQLMMFAGEISELRREVPFELAAGVKFSDAKRATPPLRYFCDFAYRLPDGRTVIEDVKGMRTRVYKIKRHLMLDKFGVEVKET